MLNMYVLVLQMFNLVAMQGMNNVKTCEMLSTSELLSFTEIVLQDVLIPPHLTVNSCSAITRAVVLLLSLGRMGASAVFRQCPTFQTVP